MKNAHEAFKALGSVNWEDVAQDQLDTLLKDVFSDAQCIVDSIPISASSSQKAGKLRSATDVNLPSLPNRTGISDRAAHLRKEWKEIKLNPRDNPLGLDIYRLGAKDGKGAWFARRSVHEGLTFEKWKLGMEKELDESMKVQGKPGDGSIRGIGADKKVVNQTVEGTGRLQVYQLSAQFPGPVAPRDFIALVLSSESAIDAPGAPRHFMLISKPCVHPECPPRQGYVRGQYESVELIREIKVEKPLRKTRSSVDLTNEEAAASVRSSAQNISREATIRSARQATDAALPTKDEDGRKRGRTIGAMDAIDEQDDEDYETMVEWLMVTRSDPGGSVPRFLVEKGTPPGIAGDAEKFLKWISAKSIDDFTESDGEETKQLKQEASQAEKAPVEKTVPTKTTSNHTSVPRASQPSTTEGHEEAPEEPNPTGFYGMIANALNSAASVAASRIPNPFGPVPEGEEDSSDLSSEEDDTSSIHSFHSIENDNIDENDATSAKPAESSTTQLTPSVTNGAESTRSTDSLAAKSTTTSTQHEKELRKLEDRKRKAEEKLRVAQEKALAKRGVNNDEEQREEAAVRKLREKHDREVTRQREKYERELKKLEAKRAGEARKAEEKRRKTLEKEDKANLAMELDKVRAERDIARKQMEMLKEQVGELQAQNTMLVARLGREGVGVGVGVGAESEGENGGSSAGGSEKGGRPRRGGSIGPGIKRAMTDGLPKGGVVWG
ncbi:uncharacterized protein F4822DRAFT_14099 [Hypoxylon trugodes]|uniref:uncharacterized protein n=1 Tax=Hypoxylon trugodes TaxID=326681 RepID=UPI00218CFAB6|nr:uncharacterized protein F4822DRAFT_14099 [Hypoxylon trugodes]KAI1393467.1 hypothetical protein F4822DRAFT_14099 [Hypoxylon trugodes]